MMKRSHLHLLSFAWFGLVLLLVATPVSAHESPEGAEWLMADWMLLTFLVFFGVALITFLTAVRRGHFSNLEDAKYHILTIDEPDYYTPEWAQVDEGEGRAADGT